jgi:hypothetical protein
MQRVEIQTDKPFSMSAVVMERIRTIGQVEVQQQLKQISLLETTRV